MSQGSLCTKGLSVLMGPFGKYSIEGLYLKKAF